MNRRDEMKNYIEMPDISPSIIDPSLIENAKIPPNSSQELKGKMVEYNKGKSLIAVFPVQEKHTNPMGFLQGGILSALFDDTVGPLSYLIAKRPVVTTGFNVQFIRGIKPGAHVIIKAEVVSKTTSTILFQAEAFNDSGKLVAIMTSHNYIMR